MRAGSMREHLVFLRKEQVQTPSGSIREEWMEVYKCRAMFKKGTPIYDKDGVNAREEFRGDNIYMVIRQNRAVEDNMRVRYNGSLYEIIPPMIPIYTDRTLQLQLRRHNE